MVTLHPLVQFCHEITFSVKNLLLIIVRCKIGKGGLVGVDANTAALYIMNKMQAPGRPGDQQDWRRFPEVAKTLQGL